MTTTEATKHEAIPLYRNADNCDHPEPDEDTPEWEEWDTDHQYGREGERLCAFSPLGRTACLACTEVAAEEEDLPMGEYVACRLASA